MVARLSEVFTIREGPHSKEDGVCDFYQDPASQPVVEFDEPIKLQGLEMCGICLKCASDLYKRSQQQGIVQP